LASLPPSRIWSLQLLNTTVEHKDGYTIGHSQRVQGYARALGEVLGLTSEQLRSLMISAAFHDIGKVGVISTILNKPGPLDTFQWRVIYMHPVLGRELWEGAVPGLRDVAEIIHQHHERWDGDGYPQGLAGEEICMGARILAVVDAYDAMCSDRPYRPALAEPVVFEELHTGAGGQFDPEAAGLFIDIIQDRKLKAA
jgi:HD-GYP domain-containing protein (c-di-GMP phosphodiesterase class II)